MRKREHCATLPGSAAKPGRPGRARAPGAQGHAQGTEDPGHSAVASLAFFDFLKCIFFSFKEFMSILAQLSLHRKLMYFKENRVEMKGNVHNLFKIYEKSFFKKLWGEKKALESNETEPNRKAGFGRRLVLPPEVCC